MFLVYIGVPSTLILVSLFFLFNRRINKIEVDIIIEENNPH